MSQSDDDDKEEPATQDETEQNGNDSTDNKEEPAIKDETEPNANDSTDNKEDGADADADGGDADAEEEDENVGDKAMQRNLEKVKRTLWQRGKSLHCSVSAEVQRMKVFQDMFKDD